MQYQTENKLPIVWGAAGLLAYLSLGPVAAAGVALMWQSRVQRQVCIERGWMQAPDYLPALPAVDVQALPMGESLDDAAAAVDALVPEPITVPPQGQQSIAPGHQPIAPTSITVPVSVHNHLGQQRSAAPRTASPAQAERRTEAPDLSLYPEVTERMTVLLQAMAESGFPLGSILKRPFVWCYGGSQSGKTTAAMLLSAARIAMGEQVGYLSTDHDVEPLKWSSLSLGPEPYADELAKRADRIRRANKNELRGQGLCVDEMYSAHTEWGIDLNQVMGPLLEKGAKSKLLFIGISQQDTSGAHGLTNIDAAWRQTRSVLEAIHEFDEHGEPYPSGRYLYSHGGGQKEEWTLPEWMLGELNSYGDPCPVVWLLNRFPELRQGRTQSPPTSTTAAPAWASMGQPLSRSTDSALSDDRRAKRSTESTETLDSAYSVATDSALTQCPSSVGSQCLDEACSVPDPATESIIRWLEKRGDDGATVGDVVAARLGPLKTMQAQDVRECLDLLVAEQVIEQTGKRYRLW